MIGKYVTRAKISVGEIEDLRADLAAAMARAESAEAEAAKRFAAGAEQMRSACLTAIRSIRHDAQDTEFDVGFEAFRVIALGTLRANLLAALSAEAKPEGGA